MIRIAAIHRFALIFAACFPRRRPRKARRHAHGFVARPIVLHHQIEQGNGRRVRSAPHSRLWPTHGPQGRHRPNEPPARRPHQCPVDNARKNRSAIHGLSAAGNRTNWNTIDETVKDIHPFRPRVSRRRRRHGPRQEHDLSRRNRRLAHLPPRRPRPRTHPAQLKKIGDVDVLMIPVGGVYTLNGSEAKKVVEQIKPKEYIFPMHYGTKIFEPPARRRVPRRPGESQNRRVRRQQSHSQPRRPTPATADRPTPFRTEEEVKGAGLDVPPISRYDRPVGSAAGLAGLAMTDTRKMARSRVRTTGW